MMQKIMEMIDNYTQPIKQFIDNDVTVEVLNPNDVAIDDMTKAYQEAINYNNLILTHKASLVFLMSKLLEKKFQITSNTTEGGRTIKQINVALDYLNTLEVSIESLRLKYRDIINYYVRYC